MTSVKAERSKLGLRSLQRQSRFTVNQGLSRGGPDLIDDDCHHEKQIETKRPENQQFGAFEMAAGDVVLFCANELIVFEGG